MTSTQPVGGWDGRRKWPPRRSILPATKRKLSQAARCRLTAAGARTDASRDSVVRVALVGGPMYDPLFSVIPAFERETGLSVDVVAKLRIPS